MERSLLLPVSYQPFKDPGRSAWVTPVHRWGNPCPDCPRALPVDTRLGQEWGWGLLTHKPHPTSGSSPRLQAKLPLPNLPFPPRPAASWGMCFPTGPRTPSPRPHAREQAETRVDFKPSRATCHKVPLPAQAHSPTRTPRHRPGDHFVPEAG